MPENSSSLENNVSPHEISPFFYTSSRESIVSLSESNSVFAESTLSPSEYNPLPSEPESSIDPFRDLGIPDPGIAFLFVG